ncbi:hypothetical protein [Romboutsia sp.]|uniref:hypothetical protein n=1 Tax=Romboutsia sp. TaxID=1965302 RepID=UPI003F301DB5
MSPLAKQIIETLSNEEDEAVLAQVLDYYEFLKEKKKKELDKIWNNISEDEPSKDEVEIINKHIDVEKNETISLDDLARDLGLND